MNKEYAPPGCRVAALSWREVERRLATGKPAVLAIGAGAKEHGYHMPLDTDYRQAEWLVDRLCESHSILAWPTLPYGYYPSFVDYPGSISLGETSFAAAVTEILDGIQRAGARMVFVLNTGISTIPPLERVMAGRDGCHLVNVYSGPRFAAVEQDVQEQPWGGHADEIETSMLLAIAPGEVNMALAEGNPARIERGRFNRHDAHAPNYSASGANGDPRLATAAKGARLVEALRLDVIERIEAAIGNAA
ncbi:MAG: creatininase family protein [Gammaproteobacteria bacterium]|nr:creatininase family protein [Gammaproteobacteria bacterium]